MSNLLRKVPTIMALGGMAASFILATTSLARRAAAQNSCAWIGVPCNITGYCNYNGQSSNITGCTCDLNNICAQSS